ncbi:histamine H2 receptor [Nematostella vectensis]|uniref:histamine H2 receptor n=1 Tax=Nematostella vectensis TaxID=45351 RepID=UPI0013905E47|nr:histamine H2 receptor [Nematostella vectensis]
MKVENFSCYHFTDWDKHGQIAFPEFIAVAVINTLTLPLTVLLNILVIISIWRTPTLHTPAMLLLSNLALSDLAVGLIGQPAFLASTALELYVNKRPNAFCYCAAFSMIMISAFGGVSFTCLTAMALDRFLALLLHLRYPVLITVKRVIGVCVCLWVLSLCATSFSYVLGVEVHSITAASAITVCNVVAIISYAHIYRILRRHQTQIQATVMTLENNMARIQQYKKSVMGSLCIYLVFILCWAPALFAFAYFEVTKDYHLSPSIVRVGVSVAMANSALNPIIYCWKHLQLRNAFWHTVTSLREWAGH